MINPQLVEYVRVQRANGLSKEAILQALAAGGWTPADVQEAMAALDGVKMPPTAVPPPAPSSGTPLQPRVIVPPPGGVMTNPQPIGGPIVVPQIQRPSIASSEFSTARVRASHTGLWVLLLLFLVVGGVAAYVYLNPSILDSITPMFQSFLPEPTPEDPFLDTPTNPNIPTIDMPTPTPEVPASTTTATTTATSTRPK